VEVSHVGASGRSIGLGLKLSPRGARTGRATGGRPARAGATDPQASATNGIETKLWQSADMLRNNMDAAS